VNISVYTHVIGANDVWKYMLSHDETHGHVIRFWFGIICEDVWFLC